MDGKTYRLVKLLIVIVIAVVISFASDRGNIWLALGGVLGGMVLMLIAQSRVKEVMYDERVMMVAGKASGMTYRIVTLSLALMSLVLLIFGREEGQEFLHAQGMILAFISMYSILVYFVSYWLFNREHE